MTQAETDRQRIDKWLWFARMARTRTAAAQLVADGHVRLNGQRITQAAKALRPGDVLTVALQRDVRLLRVLATGARRGPYEEARLLYEDLAASDAAS
ncbi:MAG TPA: RNA-binding S4 domain-containing protein [Rhodoblastus sp.]|mgnify:CR=1 FL=1|nr:RNA-binding S4 domain-containing protein [Rhodoblastus sp.]